VLFDVLLCLPKKLVGHFFKPVTAMLDELSTIEELW